MLLVQDILQMQQVVGLSPHHDDRQFLEDLRVHFVLQDDCLSVEQVKVVNVLRLW